MIFRLALCAGLLCSTAAAVQTDSATDAIEKLQAANQSLDAADGAQNPVQTLTSAIHAYEAGLDMMGDGVRVAAAREAQLNKMLALHEAEIARLLMALQVAGASPSAITVMHPAGPVGAVRAQMMMAEMKPALTIRAAELRVALEERKALQATQTQAVEVLQDALAKTEQARTALSAAVATRTDLPQRFEEDPVRTAILISSVETMEGFTGGLSQISAQPIASFAADVSGRKGMLDLPVQGTVQDRSGAGVIVATRPRALVTSPTAATIRYRGPLLDMGNVMILEPQPDLLLVFAGLQDVFGRIGNVIPAGTPIGFMGGNAPEIGTILSLSGDGTGAQQSEALYMEIRESGRPVDPATWFRTDKDG